MHHEPLTLIINGKEETIHSHPGTTLLHILRYELGLTGAKASCEVGECGACTVLVDGQPANSCLLIAGSLQGCHITTIEGLSAGDSEKDLHPVQMAMLKSGAVQCGFCTPGMVLSAKALLDDQPSADYESIREALSGNLCRCTGYGRILHAIASLATGGESQ